MMRSVLIGVALVACGGSEVGSSTVELVDGEPDIPWADDGGPQVRAPEIDWLEAGRPNIAPPDFGDCRAGWSPVEQDGVTVCEPWPEGRKTCTGGEAQFPGEAVCAPVDGACPTGDFAEGLTGEARHVLPGATGGDGTLLAPFATVQEAVDSLPVEGGVVALGRGDHLGAVLIDRPVELIGACAAETRIVGSECGPGAEATLTATADLTVRSMQITGSACPGVRAAEDFIAEGVVIQDVAGPGLWAERVATLNRVAVRDVGDGELNTGVRSGDSFAATDLSIERTIGYALAAKSSGLVALDGVAITDVAFDEEQNERAGLFAPSVLGSYRGVVIEGVPVSAAVLYAPQVFEDVVIRGRGEPIRSPLRIRGQGKATLSRLWVEATDRAVRAEGVDIDIEDALIQGVAEAYGYGVVSDENTPLTLERVVVRGFATAVNVESDLLALDVVLQADTPISSAFSDTVNIGVYRGELIAHPWYYVLAITSGFGGPLIESKVTLSNVLARGGSAGLYGATYTVEHTVFEIEGSPLSALNATDLTMSDTLFRQKGDEYTVLLDAGSGLLNAERVAFEGSDSFAVYWTGGTAKLTDISVEDSLGGLGVIGGQLDLTRARISNTRGVGLAVGNEGTATVQDVFLTGTARGDDPDRPAVALYCSGRLLAEHLLTHSTDGLSVVVDGGEVVLNDASAPDGMVVQRRGAMTGARVRGEVELDPETLVPVVWGF